MYDVVALGEALIDFSPADKGPMGNPCFEMNPGGAPINCLAANVRLGGSCAFIGMVGNDFFGRFLQKSMERIGIDTTGLVFTDTAPTTIDFVSNSDDGEREFAFFRDPGADMKLQEQHADRRVLLEANMFHFGTLSLTDEPARSATYAALDICRENGIRISFDPNYRDSLWPDKEAAVSQMRRGVEYADIIKVSLEEMEMITDVSSGEIEKGAEVLYGGSKTAVFVTLGNKGAYYLTPYEQGFVEGYKVKAVDTTGCGDAFLGAVHFAMRHRPNWSMGDTVRFANATAALCATKQTGFPAMPDYDSVEEFIAKHSGM